MRSKTLEAAKGSDQVWVCTPRVIPLYSWVATRFCALANRNTWHMARWNPYLKMIFPAMNMDIDDFPLSMYDFPIYRNSPIYRYYRCTWLFTAIPGPSLRILVAPWMRMELAKDDNLISGDAWRKGCLRKFSPWPADGCKIDEVYSIYINI